MLSHGVNIKLEVSVFDENYVMLEGTFHIVTFQMPCNQDMEYIECTRPQ